MLRQFEGTTEKWVKVAQGVPVRSGLLENKGGNAQVRDVACGLLLGVSALFGLIGCFAAFSPDPKDEEMGYRLLKVAKTSGDVAKSVCNC
jgi:hypothetical protein